MLDVFAGGDDTLIPQLVAEDYVDHQGLDDREMSGQGGFRQVVLAAREAIADLQIHVKDVMAEGDWVAARIQWIGRVGGQPLRRETIDIVKTRDGRAVEHWGAEISPRTN